MTLMLYTPDPGEPVIRYDVVPLSTRLALKLAAEAFGVRSSQIAGQRRSSHLYRARAAVMWCARQTGLSYPIIARALGNRDHTTIMHGVQRAEGWRQSDPSFRAVTDDILKRIA